MTEKKLPRLRVVNDTGVGYKTHVYIDGEDVSELFNDVRVNAPVRGAVEVQLNAIICEVEVDGAMRLKMPIEGTREILEKHGWTPPAEPVEVPAPDEVDYEPLDATLSADQPFSGRSLVDHFAHRLQTDWQPDDGGEFSVCRIYDEHGRPVKNKRSYTMTVTMNSDHPEDETEDASWDSDDCA